VTEPGVQGEICSAGESLANGYYKEPEQTAEKFVLYPVDGTEQRMYRTGDLGSYDEEGNIVFAGRKISRSNIWDTGLSWRKLSVL